MGLVLHISGRGSLLTHVRKEEFWGIFVGRIGLLDCSSKLSLGYLINGHMEFICSMRIYVLFVVTCYGWIVGLGKYTLGLLGG